MWEVLKGPVLTKNSPHIVHVPEGLEAGVRPVFQHDIHGEMVANGPVHLPIGPSVHGLVRAVAHKHCGDRAGHVGEGEEGKNGTRCDR